MTSQSGDAAGVRLQKVLAAAGAGSRRQCEELIAAGRVSVDGKTVREQGVRVDPERAAIAVDGLRLHTAPSLVYLALNKPRGVLSAMSDERGRPCLSDLVPERNARLFHVGRLDADSEGLLLLTNDGELAHRLTHPSFGVPKTYLAEVSGLLPRRSCKQLEQGVSLDDGPARADRCRIVDSSPGRTLVEVVLHEGRQHIVRRLLAAVGHPVQRLVRTAVGPVLLGDLRPGRVRHLRQDEVGALFAAVSDHQIDESL